jgi:hypothetical protein
MVERMALESMTGTRRHVDFGGRDCTECHLSSTGTTASAEQADTRRLASWVLTDPDALTPHKADHVAGASRHFLQGANQTVCVDCHWGGIRRASSEPALWDAQAKILNAWGYTDTNSGGLRRDFGGQEDGFPGLRDRPRR